mmetsp:Transcript_27274/g.70104  ORF Transcript_27274/g.70104 Transcript_27274/m.70104 type:complete len:278 (+) Transcript_27274:731-1564(+)
MPWHKCTPALPKPMPAYVAANAICSLAAGSPCLTAATKLSASSRSVSRHHTSEMGLEPWYAGRRDGSAGRGERLLYGNAVYASSAWHNTSKPLAAAIGAGMPAVLLGSTMPSVGLSSRLPMPVLARRGVWSKMATPVVSDPVPAVVGTAMSGLMGAVAGTARPAPTGAFTKSRKAASGCAAYRFITFAVSMEEPPPTAMYASKPPRRAKVMAAPRDTSVGSTDTLSNKVYATPAASMASNVRCTGRSVAMLGSVTTHAWRAPRLRRSAPTSRVAPTP